MEGEVDVQLLEQDSSNGERNCSHNLKGRLQQATPLPLPVATHEQEKQLQPQGDPNAGSTNKE